MFRGVIIGFIIQTHVNRNPATAGNESWWELFEGNRQATTASRGTVEIATGAEVRAGASDTASVTPLTLLTDGISSGALSETGSVTIPINVSGVRQDIIVKCLHRPFLHSPKQPNIPSKLSLCFP